MLVDVELDAGLKLDATEWRAAPVERKDGGRQRWSAVERDTGGQSGTVESNAAAWSCWSTPRRCRSEGAVNGEEWMTGSRTDMIGGEWMSSYASEECWAVGLVSQPTNENVWTNLTQH
jgi:hypothetical protein